MRVTPLEIPDVLLIELDVYGDDRGFFMERFHAGRFRSYGLPAAFPQVNHSRSAPGVVRGLHYQSDPAQGKLVGVARGKVWDIALDIRAGSATFGRHVALELDDIGGCLLWIPPGFAHGFCVMGGEPADLLYLVDEPYNPKSESGIAWNDPQLAISWPVPDLQCSARDTRQPSWRTYCGEPVFAIADG